MIRNIVFDMGNVLFRFEAHRFIAAYTQNESDQRLLENGVFRNVAWVEYDRGSITSEQALQKILLALPERLHEPATRLFHEWHHHIQPDERMFSYISDLKQQGYRIFLLSNAARNFYDFRSKLPGLEMFDGLFISCDWNLLKPEPEIYRSFCAHFSLVPSECLFIDDLPCNVEGALRCGLSSVVYHGNPGELSAYLASGYLKK